MNDPCPIKRRGGHCLAQRPPVSGVSSTKKIENPYSFSGSRRSKFDGSGREESIEPLTRCQRKSCIRPLGAALGSAAFDVVVSNPPYIPLHALDGLPREVRDHEPHVALIGSGTGVEIYRRLILDAERILRPGGMLTVELGYQDVDEVRPMLGRAWRFVEVSQDLAGWPRVLSGFYHPGGIPV